MKKRLIACLFLAGLLLGSCGAPQAADTEPDAISPSVPSAEAEATEETEETEVSFDPGIEAVDCGGATYTILSRLCDGSTYCYPYHEFHVEELNGETVNDAVFQRNAARPAPR